MANSEKKELKAHIKSNRTDIKHLKKLDKKLGFKKLPSNKYHRKGVLRVVVGGAAEVVAFTGISDLYLNYVDQFAEFALDAGDPLYAAFGLGAYVGAHYGVPVVGAYWLGRGAMFLFKSSREREREGRSAPQDIIRKGVINKDKYIERGQNYLDKKFDTDGLSEDDTREVIFAHAVQHAKDRAEYGRKLKKEQYSAEVDAIKGHIQTLQGGEQISFVNNFADSSSNSQSTGLKVDPEDEAEGEYIDENTFIVR